MTVARAYRPVRDRKGQRPTDLEDSYLGDIIGVIVGGQSPQNLTRFPNTVSTDGQMGFPFDQDSGIIVEEHDLLVIGGVKFLVTGPRQWVEEHEFAGAAGSVVDDYYWMRVEATA